MNRLADLVEDRKRLAKDAFFETHDVPVLLYNPPDDSDDRRAFKTGVTDAFASKMELTVGLATDPDLAVLRVEKRPGGIFKDRVSVGRTRNNDLQLDYPKVSKFHAYFSWAPDRETFYLTDAGSTNGTFVNGHRLAAREPVEVTERSIVSFGRYHFRFHMPEGLYQVLGYIAFGPDGA